MTTKVDVRDDGIIVSGSDEIGKIAGFISTDFVKKPYVLKPHKIKLFSGNKATISYGGLKNGEFCETCHLECRWGRNCLQYKKPQCRENPEFENLGFYLIFD